MALDNVFSDASEDNEIQQKFTSTAIMRYLVQLVRYTLLFLFFFFEIVFSVFMFIYFIFEFYFFKMFFYFLIGLENNFFLIFLGLSIDDFFAKK